MVKISSPSIYNIICKAKIYNKSLNEDLLLQAYKYACRKHANQFRKSGEPFIIHPLYVAYIVSALGLDEDSICAALLHDTIEDSSVTYDNIKQTFNVQTARLVDGLTKLAQSFDTIEEWQAKNYRKIFLAAREDIRVILLKLADRLHNVLTLKYLNHDRQIAIAKETLEIYVPIANILGMVNLKKTLEEGSLKILNPSQYDNFIFHSENIYPQPVYMQNIGKKNFYKIYNYLDFEKDINNPNQFIVNLKNTLFQQNNKF